MTLRRAGFTAAEIAGMKVGDVYDLMQVLHDDAERTTRQEQEFWSQVQQTQ